jgi:hypothetical protein
MGTRLINPSPPKSWFSNWTRFRSLKLLDRLSHGEMPSDILRVAVPDAASYEHIHTDVLSCLPGVARIQSSFAIRAVIKPPDM